MPYKWIICDHHIALEAGDEILHPSAEEVFAFVSEETCHDKNIPNPIEQMPNLHFSQVGSPIKGELLINDDGNIAFEIYVLRKKSKIPVDVLQGQIIDHCVNEHEWFYITGNLDYFQEMLNAAQISSTGKINIGQYINLIKQEFFSAHKEIINNVSPEALARQMVPTGNVPKGIHANLYKYQKEGFLWLRDMIEHGRGCILGDEMGLGKTLQIITVFQDLKDKGQMPVLVVAPVSLLENWKRECQKFAPDLSVYIHHGPNRTGRAIELKQYDVIVISYNTASSDLSMLKMIDWKCVVLDEAQNIKNPYSDRAKSVKAITRKSGIAVTGTPFENHITDIWSLVDFSLPGLLGSLTDFQKNVSDDILGAEKIEPILSPVMIRRSVKEVANDLPEKVIIPQPLVMSEAEQRKYEELRCDAVASANDGAAISLSILQKLRMFCTHHYLCDNEDSDPFATSIKYQRFCEIVEEIASKKEKAIVFTSYKKMFDIFAKDVPLRFGIELQSINGDTPVAERQKIVDWFNDYEGSVMLILNPRAAGTGLNITGANHVIHYNLEWNPSLEDQASARAYRRGQQKTVFIHRLFYINSVEEVVNDRIERKREIASTAVVGTDGVTEQNDILRALQLAPELHKKG